eukprot:TRINITY_DN200_c0_g1_i1.p1 TRINITY_DN200_c0_g1~~TRINITY_DN200_c0_g1_i1.p1  ORF type:complete len:706 (-),score=179.44 TRINITY_DN200_c0_g1_i1:109-2226(-)
MASSSKSNKDGKNLKIGPWVLGSFLGQGYAAQVREATHEKTGQRAAIKILTKDDNNEKADLLKKMREKEITIMKLVDHPNIVRLYDVYETTNHIYLVMELLQGSLFSYVVKSVRVSPNKALIFFQQIIEALEYMHKHLICHRDLKPENFLLNAQSQLKVCDFGFASLMKGDDEMMNTRCGTLHYASPDILTEGDGYDGRLHDVWSAGVNLYVMVTGELPFNDKNPKILLRKIMTGTFEFPPQVPLPYDLKDLIFRMLTVDSKQRITIPEIKRHPWFASKPYNIPQDVVAHINPEDAFEDIDEQILNAIVLLGVGWDNLEEFRAQLKKRGMNSEKVVYLLLLRKKLNPSMEAYSYSYVEKIQRAASGNGEGAGGAPPVAGSSPAAGPGSGPSSSYSSSSPMSTPAPAAGAGGPIGGNGPSTSPPPNSPGGQPPSPRDKEKASSAADSSLAARSQPSQAQVINAANASASGTGSNGPGSPSNPKDDKKKKRGTKQFDDKTNNKNNVSIAEQNQTVNSIDKILNWFQKDKKTTRGQPSAPEKTEEASPESNEGEGGEEDPFFDLLLRSTAPVPKKGDLRIRTDGSFDLGGGSPNTTKRNAPAPSPTASSAPSKPQPPTPAPSTPTPAQTHNEEKGASPGPQMAMYVAFVPLDQAKDFEDRNGKGVNLLNRCVLQYRKPSGEVQTISSTADYEAALASGAVIECIPNKS